MLYLLLAIALLLLLANSYASVVVLRSVVSERKQKLLQLAFVWLLPFAGAFLAINILKEKTRSYLFQPPSFGWSTIGENGGVGAQYADGSPPVID